MVSNDRHQIGNDKGLLSQSLKQFNIGKLIAGEWIGDEAVLALKKTSDFTYKAETRVLCLEISIEDFKTKLPKECLEQLKLMGLQKRKFFTMRMIDITATSKRVQQLDEKVSLYEKAQENLVNLLPNATPQIIKHFSNMQLLKGQKYFLRKRASMDENVVRAPNLDEDEKESNEGTKNFALDNLD